MSRMDFTPAETTVIGVLDSTVRSADSSKDSLAPRCTPPRPPVANTRMPARAASTDVAATVVPPVTFLAIAMAMSRRPTLTTDSSVAIRSSSCGARPILDTPSTILVTLVADDVEQRLARGVAGQLVPDESHDAAHAGGLRSGDMGREQQPGRGPQRVPGREGFGVCDVERGAQPPRLQLGDQRGGVHDGAAG